MTKSDYNQKRSLGRKQVLVAINHGLATPIESGAMIKLFNSIHAEVEPELESIKKAQAYMDAGHRSQLENSPEMYGVKTKGFPEIYRLHMPSVSADAEMDVADRALIQAIGRNDSPDKPLRTN
jgi:hypothetical protein